jgi:hypothetical protein
MQTNGGLDSNVLENVVLGCKSYKEVEFYIVIWNNLWIHTLLTISTHFLHYESA